MLSDSDDDLARITGCTTHIFDNPLLSADNIPILQFVLGKVDLWQRSLVRDLLYRPRHVGTHRARGRYGVVEREGKGGGEGSKKSRDAGWRSRFRGKGHGTALADSLFTALTSIVCTTSAQQTV